MADHSISSVIRDRSAAHHTVRYPLPSKKYIRLLHVPRRVRLLDHLAPAIPVNLPVRLLHPPPVPVVRVRHSSCRLQLPFRIPHIRPRRIRRLIPRRIVSKRRRRDVIVRIHRQAQRRRRPRRCRRQQIRPRVIPERQAPRRRRRRRYPIQLVIRERLRPRAVHVVRYSIHVSVVPARRLARPAHPIREAVRQIKRRPRRRPRLQFRRLQPLVVRVADADSREGTRLPQRQRRMISSMGKSSIRGLPWTP